MRNISENKASSPSLSFFKEEASSLLTTEEQVIDTIQAIIDAGVEAFISYHQKKALDNAILENIAIPAKFYLRINRTFNEKMEQYYHLFTDFHQYFDSEFESKEQSWQIAKPYLEQQYGIMPDAKTFETRLSTYFDEKFNFSCLGEKGTQTNF
jgi:hypothetical protein